MSLEWSHEVVISGMAGLYPESDDVDELWQRLLNKEDMVTIDGRRWVPGEFDVPSGTGKVKSPEKFDMAFTRLLCEQAYRAVCDAGVNPRYLDGSNTAVIMSSFSSEPEHDMGASRANQGTYNVLAFSRTMQANRLSYFLNLKGPSFQLDCSGCGGIQAIQHAYDLISTGMCAAAIYLRKDPILHLKEAKSVTEMIDTAVADDVNALLMFEYKDAANSPIEEYIGVNIATKPDWTSSLLYRVRE